MEKELINSISSILPRSYQQRNKVFESDSEIVPFGGTQMLFTVDEYSSEDQFRDGDAFNLGWNYTVATLSDIYASGGKPMYYAHSMVLDDVKRDTKYVTSFTKGIAEVLGNTGCCFIGGDIGTGINWHYTGIAMGKSKEPITRIGCKPGDLILMTGTVGAGNLEAALNIYSSNQLLKQITNSYKTWLVPRSLESKLIKRFATSCIDSSDGIMNAIMTLSELNKVGFKVTNTPYHKVGQFCCKILAKPVEMLLFAECGEYELVFTIGKGQYEEFAREAKTKKLQFTVIGEISEDCEKSLITSQKNYNLDEYSIRARDFKNAKEYINCLTSYLKENGNHQKRYNYQEK